jgi:hypothetical protein
LPWNCQRSRRCDHQKREDEVIEQENLFFFCMVLFLCLDETLVALEKSANATFVLDGVEVGVEEIEPC